MNEFKDKVVLVAGGSRGIGRGIATAFACQGAKTVLVASSAEHLAAAVEQVAKAKGAVAPETCIADLRTMPGCESVQRFVANRFGQCDILINSAGATRAGAFIEQGEDAWQDGFALKFFDAFSSPSVMMIKRAELPSSSIPSIFFIILMVCPTAS